MVLKSRSMVSLSEMVNNQRGVFFAHLLQLEERKTKDGKPFFKAVFGDMRREVSSVIWSDSPLFQECRTEWQIGVIYKIEAGFRNTQYGPQIQIFRIRKTKDTDFQDGIGEKFGVPFSGIDPNILYDEIVSLAKSVITKGDPLQLLVLRIYKEYREVLLRIPSSRGHHHSYPGGFLEHTLSVTKLAVFMAGHYLASYPSAGEQFSRDLVAAGALLHEIGKAEEMDPDSISPKHTIPGTLIGYPVLGRDIIRKYAPETGVPDDRLLLLEHIILTHPRYPDWGSVKTPASLEALLVHLADNADSLFVTASNTLGADTGSGPFTAALGPLGTPIFKQFPTPPEPKQVLVPDGEPSSPHPDAH